MLTIICGEDSISSRTYYLELREKYQASGNEIYDIKATEIAEIDKGLSESVSLFSQKLIFFTQGLNKKISRRSNPTLFSLAEEIAKKKDIELIDWEEYTSGRELKLTKGVTVKEFKVSESIFKLLDACYPKNLRQFISLLNSLPEKVDEIFIFIMLVRHVRNLLMVKLGRASKSLQSWQIAKLKSQAYYWDQNKLSSFYDGLYKIDVRIKTGNNPFSLRKSLDLLACYFL